MQPESDPRIVVLSSLFPSRLQPTAGLFVRERMVRVGRLLSVTVVAPVPWSPFDGLLRRWRRGFRPGAPRFEEQQGLDVWYPRFISIPGVLKSLDGRLMALGAWWRLRKLKHAGRLDLIDAHFAYPDGYAAVLLGKWLQVPVTITLRGKEARQSLVPALRRKLAYALRHAAGVFAVSESLRAVAVSLGRPAEGVRVVRNGVDCAKFAPVDRETARRELAIPLDANVLISIGGLVERKGFHRVLDCLPGLRRERPNLLYLIVGGSSPEGDWTERLKAQTASLALVDCVRFVGALPPERLRVALSAADVFVLATSYEGWANVFLEAMACGLPVVTTDVGGNAEVVCGVQLGTIVPYGDAGALANAIADALDRQWDRAAIRRHAEANTWDDTVSTLATEFRSIASRSVTARSARTDAGSEPRNAIVRP